MSVISAVQGEGRADRSDYRTDARINRAQQGAIQPYLSSEAFVMHVRLNDGTDVPVAVTRKQVRNLNLRVRSDGTVALSMPAHCSGATAREFLDSRTDWIGEHLMRAKRTTKEQERPVPSDGLDAGTLPLWGSLVDVGEVLEADRGDLAELAPEELQAYIDELYRAEVERVLPGTTEPLETRLNVRATRWQVRTMKTRWGSCTPKTGAIRINGALAAYPPACLEYVVAHELVHLVEPSHNERFHSLLDELCPDNREMHRLLKQPAREVARASQQKQNRPCSMTA